MGCHRKRNASHPSETIDPRHWAINNARDETESQAIRQRWDTKLVRGDGCRIGILPGCFFFKEKAAFEAKKKSISVGLPTQDFCWLMYYSFMLIFVAKSCKGDSWDVIFWVRSFYETTDQQLDCWKCTLFYLHSWNGNW